MGILLFRLHRTGEEGHTHTHTQQKNANKRLYTQVLHLPFSDLPFKAPDFSPFWILTVQFSRRDVLEHFGICFGGDGDMP